jgi:hypothetical protein
MILPELVVVLLAEENSVPLVLYSPFNLSGTFP